LKAVRIFTARDTEELVRQIFAAGAKSYILKSDATEHLVAAIKALAQHKPFFTRKVSEILFRRICSTRPRANDAGRLSTREQEIVHKSNRSRRTSD
jgi:DNA-binding NarL/FixJ family response regulator